METEDYIKKIREVEEDSTIKSVTKIGLCRRWAKMTMDKLRERFPEIAIEAREVDVSPNLQHTFLRIIIPGNKPLLWDGVGTLKIRPFCGYEDEAPTYLQNSRSDMINNI